MITRSYRGQLSRGLRAFALHLVALIAVVAVPRLVYGAIAKSSLRDVPGLVLIGGLTYPAYVLYWVSRLKNSRVKLIAGYVVVLISLVVVLGEATRASSIVVEILPALLGSLPLIAAIVGMFKGARYFARSCLLCSVLSLPIGIAGSILMVLGSAMRAMGGMRW